MFRVLRNSITFSFSFLALLLFLTTATMKLTVIWGCSVGRRLLFLGISENAIIVYTYYIFFFYLRFFLFCSAAILLINEIFRLRRCVSRPVRARRARMTHAISVAIVFIIIIIVIMNVRPAAMDRRLMRFPRDSHVMYYIGIVLYCMLYYNARSVYAH